MEKTAADRSVHSRVVDALGMAICDGTLPPFTVLRVEDLEARYDASRSVIREGVRVLGSMGLVSARQRLGIRVEPLVSWNLFDPRVIGWRMRSVARVEQVRSLNELRIAIEPEAARLAAERADPATASELMRIAGVLWAAGHASDADAFLAADILFHVTMLEASGNLMFGQLETLVGETLAGRTSMGLVPDQPHARSLQLHVDVASHVQRHASADAYAAMREIMLHTLEESEPEGSETETSEPENPATENPATENPATENTGTENAETIAS